MWAKVTDILLDTSALTNMISKATGNILEHVNNNSKHMINVATHCLLQAVVARQGKEVKSEGDTREEGWR